MQESFKNQSANGVFAVMDGHGGSKCSDFCKENLIRILDNQSQPGVPISNDQISQGKFSDKKVKMELAWLISLLLLKIV